MKDKQLKRTEWLVKHAGTIALDHFLKLRSANIHQKSRYERVTSVDRTINQLLTRELPKIVKAPVVSEEGATKLPSAKTFWVIDPLDGTTNYITGIPFFSIGIGLVVNDEIVQNTIYNPFLKEHFCAKKGFGAHLNWKPLKRDLFTPLSKSVIGISYSHSKTSIHLASAIGDKIRNVAHNTRHTGSTLLLMAYVAAGRIEAEIIVGPVTPWDSIPGMLLIKEVAGTVTDFQGNPYNMRKTKNLVVSNGTQHDKIIRVTSRTHA